MRALGSYILLMAFLLTITGFLLYLLGLAFINIDSETQFLSSLGIFTYPTFFYWYVPIAWSYMIYNGFKSIRYRIIKRRSDKAYLKLRKRGVVI